jgi:hypothetical protein
MNDLLRIISERKSADLILIGIIVYSIVLVLIGVGMGWGLNNII